MVNITSDIIHIYYLDFSRQKFSSGTLPTTNLKWTDQFSDPGLCGEKPV